MVGIAAALAAACFLWLVAAVEPGSSRPAATYAAKGTIGALGLIFCLFLCTGSGRSLRKIVGTVSLLITLLLIVAVSSGVMGWLVENLPLADIWGGNKPAAIGLTFATNAFIAWTFCFSPTVRAIEAKRH